MNPTRRDWLGFIGAGSVAIALVPACGDNVKTEVAAVVLEPTSTSFIVSVWAPATASVMIAIHLHDELVKLADLAINETSKTGALEVTDLTPDTRYEVRIATGVDDADLGSLFARTAPHEDDARTVTIAIGADVDPIAEFDSDIFGALVRAEPDLYISLGDFPYTDDGPAVAQNADDYRERHAALRTYPRVREMLSAMAMRCIYDDHEFHNDWDAHFVRDEPDRYDAAVRVWDEFFPMRVTGDVRYRSWRWGKHLECFLLDCRRYRGSNADADGPTKTMLGRAQLAWLIDGLRASTATFKLVLTSVPLDFGVGDDHWAAYRTERGALFEALVGINGVVFASADQHWFAAHRHDYGIREFQVGPLARGLGEPPPAVPGVIYRNVAYNFGLVEVSATKLVVSGVGADGTRFYKEELDLANLTPRR